MESLQLAQMLADLSDLNAAEPQAATALVSAKHTLSQVSTPVDHGNFKPPAPEHRNHQRVQSASIPMARTSSAGKFDNFSRRLLTPPITRSNSSQGSAPGTPRRESETHPPTEGDLDRASTLMALYDIRAKLKQQDNTSMMKAREKIAALAAKQQVQMMAAERRETSSAPARPTSYTFPRPPSVDH